MVDEFTQIYIHMKRHAVSEDFLNRWRAMIQTNGFVNIVVGQPPGDQLFLIVDHIIDQRVAEFHQVKS